MGCRAENYEESLWAIQRITEISESIRAHEGGPDQKVTVEGARVDTEDTQVG